MAYRTSVSTFYRVFAAYILPKANDTIKSAQTVIVAMAFVQYVAITGLLRPVTTVCLEEVKRSLLRAANVVLA